MSKTRVMVFPGAHNLPLWLMDNLEISYTVSRDEQIAKIHQGDVDVVHTSPDNLFLSDAAFLVPFLAGTVGPLHLVSTGISEKHVLAVDNPNSGFGRLAYAWLRTNEPDVQYQVVSVGGTKQRFDALTSGRATLAVMHPPFTELCEVKGYSVLGRVDVGYPTLCGACHQGLENSQVVQAYKENYRRALERLASDDGEVLARETLAIHLPDTEAGVRMSIADTMRREIVAAGVEYDEDSANRLKNLS